MEDIDIILPLRACRTIPTESAWRVQWTAPRDIKAGETFVITEVSAINLGTGGNKFKHFAKFDGTTTRVFEVDAPDMTKPIRRNAPRHPLSPIVEYANDSDSPQD